LNKLLTGCCFTWLFLLLSPVHAAVLNFQFTGTVTQVPLDEAFGDIAIGDGIQGGFSFDTSATDLIPGDPATGSFQFGPPFGMAFTVGTHQFTTSGSLNIGVLNSFVDQFTVLGTSASGDLSLELFLQDNTGTVFSNDHLPVTALPLGSFAQRDFHLNAVFAGGQVQIDGQINATSATTVPEPGSTVAIPAGLILLALTRRKRP